MWAILWWVWIVSSATAIPQRIATSNGWFESILAITPEANESPAPVLFTTLIFGLPKIWKSIEI